MQVTFLGTGTAIPSPHRAPTSLLVRAADEPLLFDTGPGVLRQLTAEGLYINDVEHVFYTHTHPDHVSDLILLIFAAKNPDMLRTRPLRLYGGQGFADFVRGVQAAYHPWGQPTVFPIHVEELGETAVEGEGWSVRAREVLPLHQHRFPR